MQNKGELCVQAQTNGTTSISDTSALLHGKQFTIEKDGSLRRKQFELQTAYVNTQEIDHFDGTFAATHWERRRKKHCDYLWN
ncbi:hypothetical protein T12_14223 [Trichinella patagoniensis]|uniref:Uncharacterized protein n=1 Tax=Trichinella patagoniensis TaxID=990121 RepID=A0A0V1A4C8_9BILA|nr:hypothetical protein T12_14223 [Trichinella patagoniensis]